MLLWKFHRKTTGHFENTLEISLQYRLALIVSYWSVCLALEELCLICFFFRFPNGSIQRKFNWYLKSRSEKVIPICYECISDLFFKAIWMYFCLSGGIPGTECNRVCLPQTVTNAPVSLLLEHRKSGQRLKWPRILQSICNQFVRRGLFQRKDS